MATVPARSPDLRVVAPSDEPASTIPTSCPNCEKRKQQLSARRAEVRELRQTVARVVANYVRMRAARDRLISAVQRESHHIEGGRVHQKSIRGY